MSECLEKYRMKVRIFPTDEFQLEVELEFSATDVFYDVIEDDGRPKLGSKNEYARKRIYDSGDVIGNEIGDEILRYKFRRYRGKNFYLDEVYDPFPLRVLTFYKDSEEVIPFKLLPMRSKFMSMLQLSSNAKLYKTTFSKFDHFVDSLELCRTLDRMILARYLFFLERRPSIYYLTVHDDTYGQPDIPLSYLQNMFHKILSDDEANATYLLDESNWY